eukprot:scaffold27929_cov62-Phaeocystis_antarctica.AAC.4
MAAEASSGPSGAAPDMISRSRGSGSTASTDGCLARKPMMGGAACKMVTACVLSSRRKRGGSKLGIVTMCAPRLSAKLSTMTMP